MEEFIDTTKKVKVSLGLSIFNFTVGATEPGLVPDDDNILAPNYIELKYNW